jgi:oligopeptide/dipeptide ABC transporter ATP-binding protein
MYLGQIVEMGLAGRIANTPRHPYTAVLWSSLVEKKSQEAPNIPNRQNEGGWDVFDFERPTIGCRFAPRCPVCLAKNQPSICIDPAEAPQLRKIDDAHQVRCHFPL